MKAKWDLRASGMSRGVSALLVFSLLSSTVGCSDSVDPEVALQAFLNDSSGPPVPLPEDELMKGKADVIALPAISVTVWAVGALIVYMGTQEVFKNTIEDFETVFQSVFGGEADWAWAEYLNEPELQADHLTESLNRIAYRSEGSDFYSFNGNDYLRFLSLASATAANDPAEVDAILDGQVRPWGKLAKEFFQAIQVASMEARHVHLEESSSEGLCARATVKSLREPFEDYTGLAKASGPIDVIPAIVLASLKATMRCGIYDGEVRDYVYSYYDIGALDAIPNTFISHMVKSSILLSKYVGACQLPPSIVVDVDAGNCNDVTFQ